MQINAKELCELLDGRLLGDDVLLTEMASLSSATGQSLACIIYPQDVKIAQKSRAGCLLISVTHAANHADQMSSSLISVDEPCKAFMKAMDVFFPKTQPKAIPAAGINNYVHPEARLSMGAVIYPFAYVGRATIGANSRIYPFAFVDDGAKVGDDCVVSSHCHVGGAARLGDRVILQPGSVVGADGYVYAFDGPRANKIRSMGTVELGDDVEVGANACIDNSMIDRTLIGEGTKIDNLVQVGHDVKIANNCAIAGQVGIAGFAQIGESVALGGQTGVASHVSILDGAQISAKSGVHRNVPANEIHSGNPAIPHLRFLRANAAFNSLAKMKAELVELKGKVERMWEGL